MTPRTPTLSATEPGMWRRLLAKTHPDAGGDHELFIWTMNIREVVCDGRVTTELKPPPRQETQQEPDCVPFHPGRDFDALTRDALILADSLPEPYASALRLLRDCTSSYFGLQADQQQRGATYKQLAAIGHRVGMDKGERVRWYRIAESIPLSRRHAGHIFSRMPEAA